jgi:hypothetical protein
MPDLYSLVGRDVGPLATFLTREEAEADLAAVLDDEPGWEGELWVEPFELVVAVHGTD